MMTKEIAHKAYPDDDRIRAFELRVEKLFAAGDIPGFVHLYIGQEASAAGVARAWNRFHGLHHEHPPRPWALHRQGG